MSKFAVPMPSGSMAGLRSGRRPVRGQLVEQIGPEEAQQRLTDIASAVLHSSMLAASMLPMLPSSVQQTAYSQLEELDEVVRSLRAVIVDLDETA